MSVAADGSAVASLWASAVSLTQLPSACNMAGEPEGLSTVLIKTSTAL